ncbi:MAG TPA: VCBS repeat-containing protein [Kofleriaceae bacterium]|nr:VCBS repeat-containing protein [Kofleriaceae bacterium]
MIAALLVFVAAGTARAHDEARDDRPFVMRAYARAVQLLDEAAAARVPPLQPPTPVAVKWKAQRLVSIDLGAPLLDLAAGDLDGDGRAEIVALTTRDVVVLSARGARGLAEIARAALPAEPPAIEPRDPVGTIVVASGGSAKEIWARSSTAGRGARYALTGADLKEVAPLPSFPMCAPLAGERERAGELAPGRDYFGGEGAARVFALRCRGDLVDESGRAMIAIATLGPGGVLEVALRTRCAHGDASCPAERRVQVAGAGVAFAIADVDSDGKPEVITSGDGAPGDPDSVSVYSAARAGAVGKPAYKKKFTGGVAGVVAADLDGSGDLEVVAAVRLAGAARVDLWLLN